MSNLRRIARIRRAAGVIRWLSFAAMAGVVVLSAYALLGGSSGSIGSAVRVELDLGSAAGTGTRWGAWLDLMPALALTYGLYRLTRLLRSWERGDLLSAAVARDLQAFAAAIVIYQMLDITAPVQVAVVHALAGQHGAVALSVSTGQLALTGLALLFLMLAWVLSEAASLADDHARII